MTEAGDFAFFTHMGDISYADDHPLKYEDTWNQWFASMEPIMATVPYMVSVGKYVALAFLCHFFGFGVSLRSNDCIKRDRVCA